MRHLLFSIFITVFCCNFVYAAEAPSESVYSTPTTVKGEIKQGIYQRQIGNTPYKFSVLIPQYAYLSEYAKMVIKEQYAPDWTYVSFGPTPNNGNIYRVSIMKKPNIPFSKQIDNVFNYITDSLVNQHHAKFEKLAFQQDHFEGQYVARGLSKFTTSQYSFLNVILLISDKKFSYYLSADLYPKSGQSINELTNSLLKDKNVEWNKFVHSLKIKKINS